MTLHVHRRQRGVTLVEMLMALAISALVIVPVMTMLDTSVMSGAATETTRTLELDTRFALDRIAAAARATPRKVLSPQNTGVDDSGTWFDKSRFRFDAGSGRLIEVRDGVDSLLADSVVAFGISARTVGSDATLVEASLELKRGADAARATTVVRMGGPRW